MATKRATTKKATNKKQLAPWSERLAKYAEAAADTEKNVGSGIKTFSLQAGVLSLDDQPMNDNQMAVIILDHVIENVYYGDAEYDPDDPAPPVAHALGRDEDTIRWSDDSLDGYAGELCRDSDINQWGSARKGRGKACRNMRRLLVIPAGQLKSNGEFELIEDPEHYQSAEAAFLRLPPTSISGFATYVKQLSSVAHRPPFAVVTRVKVAPDPKSQFKVRFEAIEEVPDELLGPIADRHDASDAIIMDAPDLAAMRANYEEQQPAKKTPRKPAAKKAVRGRASKY